jgi:hypothetical protein
MVIASQGHSPTQAPQSTQSPSLTTATPLSIAIASVGQTPTQVSQPVQVSLSILAAILNLLCYKLQANCKIILFYKLLPKPLFFNLIFTVK